MEPSEGQAILQSGQKNPIQTLKDKRDAKKAQLIAQAHKDQQRYKCIWASCGVCSILIVVLIIYYIVMYFVNGYEERDRIDGKEVAIHEQWIDYGNDDKLLNCTNLHP